MNAPEPDVVDYELREGAAWITIRRPEKLNALNRATVRQLTDAVRRAVADDQAAALVVTGAGDRAFVAGADIEELARLDPAQAHEFARELREAFEALERSPKPVIAAVNGFALGGGCELALACHVRLCADTARFGQPEVQLGLIPGAGGTQRLPRLVGRGRALDLILTGTTLDAVQAERWGLVEHVVPAAELHAATARYVATLRRRSPQAQSRALEAVVSGENVDLTEALRLEAALFALCFGTAEMREGTRAFLEKREPRFREG